MAHHTKYLLCFWWLESSWFACVCTNCVYDSTRRIIRLGLIRQRELYGILCIWRLMFWACVPCLCRHMSSPTCCRLIEESAWYAILFMCFICVTWLIHTCDMTHSYMWYFSFMYAILFMFLHAVSTSSEPNFPGVSMGCIIVSFGRFRVCHCSLVFCYCPNQPFFAHWGRNGLEYVDVFPPRRIVRSTECLCMWVEMLEENKRYSVFICVCACVYMWMYVCVVINNKGVCALDDMTMTTS